MHAGFFDYAIADEVHELKGGDTAQGNALGTLASSARYIAVLTGTLLGGYADELYHILFRLGASRMLEEGFEYGEAGVSAFPGNFGLLEEIPRTQPPPNPLFPGPGPPPGPPPPRPPPPSLAPLPRGP